MSNITDLSITLAEVSRASNININKIINLYEFQELLIEINFITFFVDFIQMFLLSAIFYIIASAGHISHIMIIIPISLYSFRYLKIMEIKQFKHFLKLYIQVLNFNSLIETAEALDEAGRSGGSNRLENREKVIKALTSIRADLISALRIEKAFRKNPNFSSSSFTPNLEHLQVLQLSEQSSEYGRLFNEALQIGMNVQEEMQTLQRR